MAPLITIFGFAYFCLVFLINRYNLIYVNEQRWQGGGMRLAFPSALPNSVACVVPRLTRAWFIGFRHHVVHRLPSLHGGYSPFPAHHARHSRYDMTAPMTHTRHT
jgi:hypothetical protein